MELGNFLGKLKGKEPEAPKKFLALILTDEVVQAAIWQVAHEQTEILSLGTPVEWDGDTGTTSELVTAADATISSATEGLTDDPSSIIFGIPSTWTDKEGILGVKREFIKHICKELELSPLGFVVITDSILSYLKLQEGTPSTSILIQVSRDDLTLLLVRLGRIEATQNIGRSEDVVEDVVEGIARFKSADNLPSRIILFNSMHNLDEIIQNLLSVDWQTQFNFLHIPKIEALAKDVAIRALAVAGGGEVAKSLGFTLTQTPEVIKADKTEIVEEPKETSEEVDESESADNNDAELVSAEAIGFTTGPVVESNVAEVEDTMIEAPEAEPVEKVAKKLALPKLAFTLPTLPKFKLPAIKINLKGIQKHWWLTGGVLVALTAFIVWFTWMLPKAMVTLYVTPKPLDQDVDITLSTQDDSINFTDHIVPATSDSVSESGEKVAETTGKKIIGDPAKGEVTIYNRTTSSKLLIKGTTIASGSLKFTLDADVTIASKSAGSDYVDVPGKQNVAITAAAIGTDSNLGSGTEFTIASFGKDSYVAKNDVALAGGTSEEIQVISKDDQKNLLSAVTDEILETLKDKVSAGNPPGTGVYIIPDSVKLENTEFSGKVGDAGKSVSVKTTLSVDIFKYATENVETLVNSAIDQAVPPGYVRSDLPSTVELKDVKGGGDQESVTGSAKVSVALLPTLDLPLLLAQMKGKKASQVESIFQTVPGYSDAMIQITPSWLPPRFKSLPRNVKNITIRLAPAPL